MLCIYASQWSCVLEKHEVDIDCYFHYECQICILFEATSHGVWLKSFISGLRVVDSIERPLRLYCDKSAAAFLAKNNKSGNRNKHINIKYLAIWERVKEKKVVIER